MGGLITRRREPRLSSLRGVCVQTGEHGHAPKYTLLSRRLRRFIYLLDSCPEPLTRFSTGAESPTKHTASFSRLGARLSHPRRVPLVPSPAGRPSAPVPAAFLFFGGCCCVSFPLSFPLLFHAFPPARLLSRLTRPHSSLFSLVFRPHSLSPSLSPHFSLLPPPAPTPPAPAALRRPPRPVSAPQHRLASAITALPRPRSAPRPGSRQPPWEAGLVDPAERSRETPAGCCPFLASGYPPSPLPAHSTPKPSLGKT